MKVTCENCQTKLNLPDDKLETGAEFSFNCPKCKQRNVVRVPEKPAAGPSGTQTPRPAPRSDGDLEGEDEVGLGDFFEEGARPVMICFDPGPARDRVVAVAQALNFVPVIPANTRDALSRLKVSRFHAVLLHESYEGQGVQNSAVLRLIMNLDMSTRRRILVILFGAQFHTLDQMNAFALSVNAVVNTSDEEKYQKILHRAQAEYERFYRVYFDVLREMGKM